MKVKLKEVKDAKDFRDLTVNNVYRVISIEAGNFRLMSDEGAPYLYPPHIFIVVDDAEPKEWQSEYGENGERYSSAPELSEPGFFELYFSGDKSAVRTLRLYLQKWRE